MKILVSRSAAGTSIGGGEMSARDHALVLRELGHEIVFVSNLSYLRNEAAEHGLKFIASLWPYKDLSLLRIPYFLLMWPLMWVHYASIALREKPDIIYPHSREDQVIFTLLKPLHRRPVVWRDPSDLHYGLENANSSPLARLNRWFLVRALKRADQVFTLTEQEQMRIIQHSDGGANIDTVKYFGSDILFSNYNRDETPIKSTKRTVIGTIIRLVEDKGVQHLIKAFVHAADKNPDIELWIVGDGNYRDELEHLAAGHPRITFWGQQDNQSKFFTAFDIFVQPAEYEGWGRTVKEAMYFGVPIIGSDVGGIALQIDDKKTGLLFAPKSHVELEKRLHLLLERPDARKKLAAAAQKKVEAEGDFVDLLSRELMPTFERLTKEMNNAYHS